MRFASLGSGSKGNASLVSAGETLLMVDCGFSLRETERRMARLGVQVEDLDAILVTHEHTDHSSGVAKLSRKYRIPVYLTHGTYGSGRCSECHQVHCFNCEDEFSIGSIAVKAIAVPHDAREPCQYRFSSAGRSLGILTDLGSITAHVVDHYQNCNGLILEFNHDLKMLMDGAYPPQLKRRVGGDWGHLNNQQAIELLQHLASDALSHLVVAHVSEKNNARYLVEQLLQPLECLPSSIVWAEQAAGFEWLDLV